MSRRGFLRFALLVSFLFTSAAAARAQVIYDWRSDAEVPEKYPQITRREAVTFTITNVNDILYTYRLQITQTPITSNDFANLSSLINRVPKGAGGTGNKATCEGLKDAANNLTSTALEKLTNEEKLPIGYADSSPKVSYSLQESLDAWEVLLPDINEAQGAIRDLRVQCGAGQVTPELEAFDRTVRRLKEKIDLPHVFEDSHVIDPGNNVSIKIIETFRTTVTKTKTFSFPGVDVLTLSAGALFSRLPDRTYEARKSPTSDLNLLTVEGNSRATPSLIGLLNYHPGWDRGNFGLALAAGPVLKLGNQSESSSFGFFAGLSGHFRRRYYITPGFHFGQFADFPVGFANGSTVPANFGELTPVKRWSARFGLAITFKTNDFSGLGGGDNKPKVTGTEANKDAKKTSSSGTDSSSDVRASMLRRPEQPVTVADNVVRIPSREPAPEVTPEVNEPRPEPVRRTEPRVQNSRTSRTITPETRQFVSATTPASITHLSSITSSMSSVGERVVLTAANPIQDYRVYFRNGRFFLSLPQTRLDVFQDGLAGQVFTDAVFEQHGDECVVSFALTSGTRARVETVANGLAVIFMPGGNN